MKEGMGMRRIRRLLTALFAVALLFALPLTAHALEDYTYTYPENYAGRIDPSVPYDPLLEKDGVAPEDRHGGGEAAPRLPLFRAALSSTASKWYPRVLLSMPSISLNAVFLGNYCLYDVSGQAILNLTEGAVYTFAYEGAAAAVYCDGAKLASGLQLEVREHARSDGKRNYFTLYKSAGDSRSYYGSLFVYSTLGSENGVSFINRIYMEDYLCGVVPYEIGEGYGAAALEAQAVAARNYAYNEAGRVANYDLLDTSADQVYRGISNAPNSAKAVADTEGKLLTYEGATIEVFYSASNGGVTEIPPHPWTNLSVIPAYMAVVKDDYDRDYARANKGSNFSSEEIMISSAGADSSGILLKNLIKDELGLTNGEAASIVLTSVTLSADCAHNVGKFAGFLAAYEKDKGSGAYYCSHFANLAATVYGSYNADAGGTSIIDANITIDATKLGNGSYGFTNNSLTCFWLIDNQDGTYTVRHGRYGHGVGLSQIGARQMAAQNNTSEFILKFYYPNTELAVSADFSGRETLTALPAISSEPRTLVSDSYVYARPDTNSLQLGVVRKGSALAVTGEYGDYSIVSYNGKTGCVLKSAFALQFTSVKIINVDVSCNIRSGPSTGDQILGQGMKNAVYPLLADAYATPGWYKINYSGGVAYVSSGYAIPVQTNAGTTIASYTVTVTPPSGYTDAVLWVDGVSYPAVSANGQLTATIYHAGAKTAVMYKLRASGTMEEMYAWTLSYTAGGDYTATPLPSDIQNLLTYHGCAIRVTGDTGLRFVSGIDEGVRAQLTGAGVGGFKLLEYGTVVMGNASIGVYPFIKDGTATGFGRSYWNAADYYIDIVGGRIQFASVLIGIAPANYNSYYGFRAYAILEKSGSSYIFYGGQVSRSLYHVAEQVMAAGEFKEDTPAYEFVNSIIKTVNPAGGNG